MGFSLAITAWAVFGIRPFGQEHGPALMANDAMGPGQLVEHLDSPASRGLDLQNHGITQHPQSPIGMFSVIPLLRVATQP